MAKGYLKQLTPRVYWSPPDSARDRPIMGAITGGSESFIIETGASPQHANQFLSALVEINAPVPRFAAVTHWHWDHVFGTATMRLPTIGHVETRRRVKEMARLDWRDKALDARVAAGEELAFIAEHVKVELTNTERAQLVILPPDITFTEQVEVNLDEVTIQIIHVGGDHSPDSSVIFAPQERAAFLGDCLYPGFIGDDDYYTLPRLFPLLDKLEALGAVYYLPSHDEEPLTRAAFLHNANRLRRIGEEIAKTGPNREALLVKLADPEDAYLQEDIDAFLRGLEADISPGNNWIV
jgi:glyoxylase-like metal-dependent hydrolase (beta-lactamase superfamily II)